MEPVEADQAATKLMLDVLVMVVRKGNTADRRVGSRMGRRQASSDIAQRVATQKGVSTKRSEDELRLPRKTPRRGLLRFRPVVEFRAVTIDVFQPDYEATTQRVDAKAVFFRDEYFSRIAVMAHGVFGGLFYAHHVLNERRVNRHDGE